MTTAVASANASVPARGVNIMSNNAFGLLTQDVNDDGDDANEVEDDEEDENENEEDEDENDVAENNEFTDGEENDDCDDDNVAITMEEREKIMTSALKDFGSSLKSERVTEKLIDAFADLKDSEISPFMYQTLVQIAELKKDPAIQLGEVFGPVLRSGKSPTTSSLLEVFTTEDFKEQIRDVALDCPFLYEVLAVIANSMQAANCTNEEQTNTLRKVFSKN
jgi:hypothetical protein